MLAVAVSAVALTSCNPFHRAQPVEVSAKDETLNSSWHANLAAPAGLAGAVHSNGPATMAPASTRGNTAVSFDLANATPGGLHPGSGTADSAAPDRGIVGSPATDPAAKVGRNGRAQAGAQRPYDTPTTGSYCVVVRASSANDAVTVAYGNLAPPTL